MADKEIPRKGWNVEGGFSSLGGPGGTEMFLCIRNSNHDSRKRQPINKVHKNEMTN
jgi:hypothetical protein